MLSLLDVPLSEAVTRSGVLPVGATVSSVKLSEAVPVLPNVSVWLATMVCGPSASPVGVNDHAPWASAVAVAAIALPSIVKFTTVLARPVPLSAAFEVMLPLADDAASPAVTVGTLVAGTGII